MAGIDENTTLMLNLNGPDGQQSTVDESANNHSFTFAATAELDTAEKKFGASSLLLDGDSDYIYADGHDDFNLFDGNTTNVTIEFFVKMTNHTGNEALLAYFQDANNHWDLRHLHNNGLYFYWYDGGSFELSLLGGEITDTNWHHVALIKIGNLYGLYLDGTQVAYINNSNTISLTAGSSELDVGDSGTHDAYFLDGHVDMLRFYKGNPFEASPNSGKTDTITVPTKEYTYAYNRTQGFILV